MNSKDIPQKMYSDDAFSQWLGMEILSASNGFAVVELKVRDEMTNGFGIAHGGIAYRLSGLSIWPLLAIAWAVRRFRLKRVFPIPSRLSQARH